MAVLEETGKTNGDWEVRLLGTAVVMGCALVAVVETTSLFKAVTAIGLGTGWLAAAAGLFALGTKLRRGAQARRREDEPGEEMGEEPAPTPEVRVLLICTGLIAAILFAVALLTPPTSWDSLTYHLPRIMNWLQNESVSHFATHDNRQVEAGPFAAFAVMQLYLVTHSDRLANLVQWGAMVCSLVGVSWLARRALAMRDEDPENGKTESSRRAGTWTAFFAVTMPIGIVQSITTQTDYVVAFWVVATALFGFLFWREKGRAVYAFLFGASMALGTLTKATMVVTAGLLCACVILLGLKATSSNAARVRAVLVMGITALILVAPHFTRNMRLFGSPLGSEYIYALMRNEYQSPRIWISNFVRNLSLHSASGIAAVTSGVNATLKAAHKLSGMDENDRASTFFTSTFAYIQGYPMSDNSAGNFWHGLVALVGGMYLAVRYPAFRKWILAVFGVVLMTFTLQNGYLRWTEWNARFHLPFFLLLAPVAGTALARMPQGLRVGCGLILALVGGHAAFYNKSRPVLADNEFLFQERERQYFVEVPRLYRPALNAVTDVAASGSTNVGLRMYKDFFRYLDEMEYPFWVMLRNRGFEGRIYNIGISNETARLSNSVPIQALISSTRGPREEVAHVLPHQLKYPPIDVYWAESHSRWLRLAQLEPDGTERPLADSQDVAQLPNNGASLVVRTARQGMLGVEVALVQNDAMVVSPTALLVRSYAGYLNASRSTNGRHSLEIPLPPGITALEIGFPGAADFGLAAAMQWRWEPRDAEVPYVYLSKFYDPAVQDESGRTNAMTIIPGTRRVAQLVAGAAGEVELQFFSASVGGAELALLEGLEHRQEKPMAIGFTNGIGSVRIQVQTGTNQCVISNASGTVVLERLDAVFRTRRERE
jgi:4-amino-4-deoxy-L-arabinose transferase-like glycosyltransferase